MEEICAKLNELLEKAKQESKSYPTLWVKKHHISEETFKENFRKALIKNYPNIIPDENAISFIVERELSRAFLAEEFGREHADDDVDCRLDGQIEGLNEGVNNLARNIITAEQIVASAENGIDESLFDTLNSNGFAGGFVDPTLNCAYQSYCEILRLEQENKGQQQAIIQGSTYRKNLIGIVGELNNALFHQNQNLAAVKTSLETAKEEITALSNKLQEEKAKGLFSDFFGKFRRAKYLPEEKTVKENPSTCVSKSISSLDSIATTCQDTDNYEERLARYRSFVCKPKIQNEQGSKCTPSNEKDNSSLQLEVDTSTENTHPNTAYVQENYHKLQNLKKTNESQQQTIDNDIQDIKKLLGIISSLRKTYVEPYSIISQSSATLRIAQQKIDKLSDELSTEKEKSFATRLVEKMKKIRASIFQKDESPEQGMYAQENSEQGISNLVSKVITDLTSYTEKYSPTFCNPTFEPINARTGGKNHCAQHEPSSQEL